MRFGKSWRDWNKLPDQWFAPRFRGFSVPTEAHASGNEKKVDFLAVSVLHFTTTHHVIPNPMTEEGTMFRNGVPVAARFGC